jgi:hypothetical protein
MRGQSREGIIHNLAERLCWQAARRDDRRVARRLSRHQVVEGVYRLDDGALLDKCFHFLQALGVLDLMMHVQGKGIKRALVPCVPYVLRYGLKTWCGLEGMNALPALLFREEAMRRLVGLKAHHVRHGVCQRGAAKRQRPRAAGPMCPAPLAHNLVKLHLQDLEALCNGVTRAVARAGSVGAKVTGLMEGTDLEMPAQYEGCGQGTRKRKMTDKHGQVHEIEVTVFGWKLMVLIDARTKLPLAAQVVPIQEHETLCLRALVTQARTNWCGKARRHKVVFARGLLDGADLWGLDQHGMTLVVPATTTMAVSVDARAQAAAGEGIAVGRRVHPVRHGQGRTAATERLEPAVVGITGLTPEDQYGTPEPGRHHSRRDFEPNPSNAVVVRQWPGKDSGPGGKTVFLTNASVEEPLRPFDDDEERSLIENWCLKEAKQQWDVGHPPQKTGRAVRVHGVCTRLMFVLATAYRLRCEQTEWGAEPVGWQRGRRQLLEQTRDQIIGFAQGCYGIWHIAEVVLWGGGKLKDVPPGVGARQEVLAKYELTAQG